MNESNFKELRDMDSEHYEGLIEPIESSYAHTMLMIQKGHVGIFWLFLSLLMCFINLSVVAKHSLLSAILWVVSAGMGLMAIAFIFATFYHMRQASKARSR